MGLPYGANIRLDDSSADTLITQKILPEREPIDVKKLAEKLALLYRKGKEIMNTVLVRKRKRRSTGSARVQVITHFLG